MNTKKLIKSLAGWKSFQPSKKNFQRLWRIAPVLALVLLAYLLNGWMTVMDSGLDADEMSPGASLAADEMEVSPDFGLLPDFKQITDIPSLKATFFGYLLPMVEYHNQQISHDRKQLETMHNTLQGGGNLKSAEQKKLKQLAKFYKLDNPEADDKTQVTQLLARVDVIPPELALVQAAKESGWGRSRFAVEANNLFGQWCYTKGCGLVPSGRDKEAKHEIKRFDSPSDAVLSYIKNLNTHSAYQPVRDIRADLRRQGKAVTGESLAPGLIQYSQRREAYVEEVLAMLRQYRKFESEATP